MFTPEKPAIAAEKKPRLAEVKTLDGGLPFDRWIDSGIFAGDFVNRNFDILRFRNWNDRAVHLQVGKVIRGKVIEVTEETIEIGKTYQLEDSALKFRTHLKRLYEDPDNPRLRVIVHAPIQLNILRSELYQRAQRGLPIPEYAKALFTQR